MRGRRKKHFPTAAEQLAISIARRPRGEWVQGGPDLAGAVHREQLHGRGMGAYPKLSLVRLRDPRSVVLSLEAHDFRGGVPLGLDADV